MADVSQLDVVKLASYLESQINGFKGPISADKFPGGQSNPTFKITAESGVYVLRRQPPGKLLKSAHAVDREFRVLAALANSDVPVAKVYHLCEDRDVIGSMFYVMEYCDGNVHWDAQLPEVGNATRGKMYDEMNRVLAALHSVDLAEAGLEDYGKPGNYFARQLDRWTKQYRASELEKIDEMDQLIDWLENNQPEDDGRVSLVHGDYRLDNVMFDKSNQNIIAVLDWELSTLGHPFADLAYQCMQLRMPGAGDMKGLMGIDRAELNIPSEEEYVAQYCKRMGLDSIPNWEFYIAFSYFRLAAIIQGVAKRAADGNASNKKAAQMGAYVKPMAQFALDTIAQA
ncbi:phosphotransferase family protein [Pseudoteredinibacter isoporae]|uniref:Aminoglycoside phosphotransferase (APT) family kinase protein n=1 Tax=Pseudoteredinibacter isoporae TaxID=570281 RepID=A0A7X0JUM8_9GAMM|nr:phosphotransferase family protein [Pseudoteredinibacter isoporae]MBB6522149.1 aminoglycoside phosphotransferase (APT) family kinase protein [Pseudoteredinibacter isoporae]NHO87684.1 phosphotransferase family protein [Pseudoteredinibacter isoporae]NIB23985.1 phosphotransferase family protein [Pseudoteredinibacter isoporae]